jgi:hypothetical protein
MGEWTIRDLYSFGRANALDGWGFGGIHAGDGLIMRCEGQLPDASHGEYYLRAWTAEWFRLKRPTLDLSASEAATLIGLPMPDGDVVSHHRVWLITLPPNVVLLSNRNGYPESVRHVLCAYIRDATRTRWAYSGVAETCEWSQMCQPIEHIRAATREIKPWAPNMPLMHTTLMDRRASVELGKLVLNGCLMYPREHML